LKEEEVANELATEKLPKPLMTISNDETHNTSSTSFKLLPTDEKKRKRGQSNANLVPE
jgi:hypothetical protein